MPEISKQGRAFVLENFFERKSYIAVEATFQQQSNQVQLCKKTIEQNVTKYQSHVTSLNRNKESSGRQRTAHSEKNIFN